MTVYRVNGSCEVEDEGRSGSFTGLLAVFPLIAGPDDGCGLEALPHVGTVIID